jgi:hypothetical protein
VAANVRRKLIRGRESIIGVCFGRAYRFARLIFEEGARITSIDRRLRLIKEKRPNFDGATPGDEMEAAQLEPLGKIAALSPPVVSRQTKSSFRAGGANFCSNHRIFATKMLPRVFKIERLTEVKNFQVPRRTSLR